MPMVAPWKEELHPRQPAGYDDTGGQFAPKGTRSVGVSVPGSRVGGPALVPNGKQVDVLVNPTEGENVRPWWR